MSEADRTKQYFDTLLKNYDILADALEKASDRGLKLSKQFTTDVTNRQRRAIELAQKVASEPMNVAAAYSAIMEATVAAQSQALELTQLAYREGLAASSEAREVFDALIAMSRSAAQDALEFSKEWSGSNPFTDMMRKGMETFSASMAAASQTEPAKTE